MAIIKPLHKDLSVPINQKVQVFFAWTAYQRRAETMQPFFGYSLYHLPPPLAKAWMKPLGYFVQFWQMMTIIRRKNADVVWIQLPPTIILHMLYIWNLLNKGRYQIIVDCHNRTFRAPWISMPGTIKLLNLSKIVLVHNQEIKQTAISVGIDQKRLVVLEDPPAIINITSNSPCTETATILVPCSFNPDEPISELIAAARGAPEITFLVTGNLEKAREKGFVDNSPENVVWTGFVPTAEYEKMLSSSTVVLGLTNIEGIQLSVASEAIGAGKAMVLSDTTILRAMFGQAALFTRHDPASMIAACREAVARCAELSENSSVLRDKRWVQWRKDAQGAKIS